MFHFTIFGGTEAQMPATGFSSITLFGATELTRPTVAQRVLQIAASEDPDSEFRRSRPMKCFALTICGATEIFQPLLMEEYASLCGLVAAQILSRQEIQTAIADIITHDAQNPIKTMTLCAGFSEERPTRKKQLQALNEAEDSGLIPKIHRLELEQVIDAGPAVTLGLLGRFVDEVDLPPDVLASTSSQASRDSVR